MRPKWCELPTQNPKENWQSSLARNLKRRRVAKPPLCLQPIRTPTESIGRQTPRPRRLRRASRGAAWSQRISMATGLGIAANIIDCYAAIIRLYKDGDSIFLIGFRSLPQGLDLSAKGMDSSMRCYETALDESYTY